MMVILSGSTVLNGLWCGLLLGLLYYFVKKWHYLRQAQDWLLTEGHITHFELIQQGRQLWPKIEYIYQVYGRDFYGENLVLDTAHNTPSNRIARLVAYHAAQAFYAKQAITIFYNPNDPRQSTLDIHMPRKLLFILGLLVVLLVFHLSAWMYGLSLK
tara:strand:+ start:1249 stop:1719 length:471 start_codon:yes stop_codon:yes gene_type:complete